MQIVRENRRKKPPQTERFRPGRELAATMEIETAEDPEVIDAEVLKAFADWERQFAPQVRAPLGRLPLNT